MSVTGPRAPQRVTARYYLMQTGRALSGALRLRSTSYADRVSLSRVSRQNPLRSQRGATTAKFLLGVTTTAAPIVTAFYISAHLGYGFGQPLGLVLSAVIGVSWLIHAAKPEAIKNALKRMVSPFVKPKALLGFGTASIVIPLLTATAQPVGLIIGIPMLVAAFFAHKNSTIIIVDGKKIKNKKALLAAFNNKREALAKAFAGAPTKTQARVEQKLGTQASNNIKLIINGLRLVAGGPLKVSSVRQDPSLLKDIRDTLEALEADPQLKNVSPTTKLRAKYEKILNELIQEFRPLGKETTTATQEELQGAVSELDQLIPLANLRQGHVGALTVIKDNIKSRLAKMESVPAPSDPTTQGDNLSIALTRQYTNDLDGLRDATNDFRYLLNLEQTSLNEGQETAVANRIVKLRDHLKTKGQELYLTADDSSDTTRHYLILLAEETASKRGNKHPQGKLLGKGGMAEVYQGIDLEDGKLVAIKVLVNSDDPELKKLFEEESKNMMGINHPNVVKVLSRRGSKFFVMEYIPWPTLARHIRSQRLSPQEAIPITIKICEIMRGVGIHHRDIKPANIFIFINPETGKSVIKIMDFGIAKFPKADVRETSTGIVMGTHPFMAPAYAANWGQLTRHAKTETVGKRLLDINDIYAIGAVLYRMLTGQNLTWKGNQQSFCVSSNPDGEQKVALATVIGHFVSFEAQQNAGNIRNAQNIKNLYTLVREFESRGVTIPQPLYDVIAKMTAFDPADGYSSMFLAKQALERALEDIQSGTARVPLGDRSRELATELEEELELDEPSSASGAGPAPTFTEITPELLNRIAMGSRVLTQADADQFCALMGPYRRTLAQPEKEAVDLALEMIKLKNLI